MGDIKTYLVRRLLLFMGVIFGVTVLTFLITHILPIDPVAAILGPMATPEAVAARRHELGLDRPLLDQFADYLKGIFALNLGNSVRTKTPVLEDLRVFVPATLELSTAAFFIALIGGITIGSLSAIKRNTVVDHFLRVFSVMGISAPPFWLGFLSLLLFGLTIPLFPGGGRLGFAASPPPLITGFITIDSLLVGQIDLFFEAIAHITLPALVLGFWGSAWIARHTRSSILEVTQQDYITMARAKGLQERKVFMKHILRNAMIPPITISGLVYGAMISGAVAIEIVFSYAGLGLYSWNSVLQGDYNAIVGVALVSAIAYSLINLIIDLLYPLIDPRIVYE